MMMTSRIFVAVATLGALLCSPSTVSAQPPGDQDPADFAEPLFDTPVVRWSRVPDFNSWASDMVESADGTIWLLCDNLREVSDDPSTAREPAIFQMDPSTGETLQTVFFPFGMPGDACRAYDINSLVLFEHEGNERLLMVDRCGSFVFDITQSQFVWSVTGDTQVDYNRPVVNSEGTIAYVATSRYTLQALNVISGEVIYETESNLDTFTGALTLSADETQLYGVENRQGSAYIFDAATGQWVFRGSSNIARYGPSRITSPLVANGQAFFGLHSNRGLTRYDLDTVVSQGNRSQVDTWTASELLGASDTRTNPIAENDEFLYGVFFHGERLAKVKIADGSTEWSERFIANTRAQIALEPEVVVYGVWDTASLSGSAYIERRNAQNGQLEWRYVPAFTGDARLLGLSRAGDVLYIVKQIGGQRSMEAIETAIRTFPPTLPPTVSPTPGPTVPGSPTPSPTVPPTPSPTTPTSSAVSMQASLLWSRLFLLGLSSLSWWMMS